MKRTLALILALMLALTLFACGQKEKAPVDTAPPENTQSPAPGPETSDPGPAAEPVTLTVFAAASMTETMDQIIEAYKAIAPNVTVVPTYDSSGTLLTQIREGAECDIFISAAQKQMNALDVEKSEDGMDAVLAGTRLNLVENRVALVVPEGNPGNIAAFDDIAGAESIALGNADVPVGQYSEEILSNMGVWAEIQSKTTFGSNVKEVTSWVSEAAAACGIVYATDAFSAGLEIVDFAPAGTLQTPVLYPAAVLKETKNPDAAKAFLDYLKSDAAVAVFESVGFAIPA